MAEINVQKKTGSSAMWWILAIVAILVVGWMMFARNNDAGATDTPPRSSIVEQPGATASLVGAGSRIVDITRVA